MNDLSLPITTALVSVLALWLVVLSVAVITIRRANQVSVGDGGNRLLQRRARAQANLTEYAPLFVIMIAVAEAQGGNVVILSVLSVVFVLGRLSHGISIAFTDGHMASRAAGMMCTFAPLVLAAIYSLVRLVF